jgi:hypothetical protein
MLVTLMPAFLPSGDCVDALRGVSNVPKHGRVDEIAAFLNENMSENDTVQALDWTGGALHAMLLARAGTATPFLYDMLFYHHLSSKYVRMLRARFMDQLLSNKPDYIIDVYGEDKPWVSGPDTTRAFPELRSLIRIYYVPAFRGDGYTIFKRTTHDLK